MPPSLNKDTSTLSEHELLELGTNAVVELAAADDLASGLDRVVTSVRRFSAAPRVELWSPDEDGIPTLLAASGQGPGRRESIAIEGVGVLVLVGARAEPHLASTLAPLGRIVRRRRAEEALSQMTTDLARRNEALEDFAALVAHELKTPLHAALVADDASGLVEQALELVDTLLEAAQTEASSGSVASVEESLALAVRDVGGGDLDVTAELDAPVPLPAESLRIILRNLLANAAAAGAHHVQVSSFRSQATYRVDVEDDGVGLTGIGSYSSGSGIGLGLSRRIAARFGGTLELSPRPFEGTRASLVFAEAPR
jgi:signal transduction histidine kinase